MNRPIRTAHDAMEALAELAKRLPADLLILSEEARDRTAQLHASELAAIDKAVDIRRREFSTGRWLARQGLRRLGVPPSTIPVGRSREPLWPDGIIGSLTHSSAICAVMLGHARDYEGLGLDLELTNAPLGDLADIIISPAEAVRRRDPGDLRLLFSAKEAVYKCLYPLYREFLDFQDLSVTLDRESSTFSARLHKAAARSQGGINGRGLFEAAGEAVVTAYLLPADLAARG